MKKVFIMAIAVTVMTLTGCKDSKTTAPKADADSTMTDSAMTDSAATGSRKAEATPTADQLISQLNAKVKANDGKGLATQLATVMKQMEEMSRKDPKKAQEYITKVQQWVLDNGKTIQSILKASGNEPEMQAITGAVNAATKNDQKAINDEMDKAKEKMKEAAKSATPEQKEAAKKAVQDAAGKMQGKAGEAARKAVKDLF
ncbi:biopolymer transporter [uncultured Prevotella sp.]|jgi:putative lipoprotein|uniref:biopolymer transporter n=1 Tax=uncultured Prevotella sp. TaxID=159272 RepID=UPI0028044254|nr:biopolymer transporter [uncultured Prevotella sp.]